MAKDPAFLFYPQRWLEGTAEMSPPERGIYIDLLAYQHQKGSIPQEPSKLCRLVRLSESEFIPIWEGVKNKFRLTTDNRLVNQTLDEIKTERSTKSVKNIITGTLAAIIRLSGEPAEINEQIKKSFKIDAFLTVPKENLTDRLGDWYKERLKSIINGNINGNTSSKVSYGINNKVVSGKKFDEKGERVFFEDGTYQLLGMEQRIALQAKTLSPRDVKKGMVY